MCYLPLLNISCEVHYSFCIFLKSVYRPARSSHVRNEQYTNQWTSHHFSTRFSQSPTTATQMSLTPTSLRRWNQMGKNTKKVVWRSATEETHWNRFSESRYSVCKETARFTPQLWSRSIFAVWDRDGHPGTDTRHRDGDQTACTQTACQASSSLRTLVFCSSWTLFKARWIGFVCLLTGELRGPRFQDLSPVMTLMGHILIKCWVDTLISFVFGFMECDVTV